MISSSPLAITDVVIPSPTTSDGLSSHTGQQQQPMTTGRNKRKETTGDGQPQSKRITLSSLPLSLPSLSEPRTPPENASPSSVTGDQDEKTEISPLPSSPEPQTPPENASPSSSVTGNQDEMSTPPPSSSPLARASRGCHWKYVIEVARHASGKVDMYRVQWEDGDQTWEPPSFRDQAKNVTDWEEILRNACEYGDSKKVQSTKARWQRLYATNERRGGTATMKTRSPSKAVVQDDICTACGLECVGLRCTQDHCLSFICTRCNTANPSPLCPGHGGPPLTDDVTLRGLPRRQPVRLHIDAVDPAVAAHVKQSLSGQTVVITHADAAATTKIDILFVVYHTDPAWNASHHTQLINESMGTSSPALVGVFACWYPDQEVEALTALSIAHPGVTFITFRIPDLVLLSKQSEYLRQTAVAAINTIRYPDAPQYMYLSDLCTVSKKEAVIFERGVGPLQVAYNILPRCCCGGKYPFKTSSRWKQDMHDERSIRMWHRRCRGKTVRCLDLLLIDHKAVCE
jgi:hypothetical protein